MRRSRAWALVVALIALRVALDFATLAGDPTRFLDDEDGYNAAAAWLFGHTGAWRLVPALQYRSFCGGCSVLAVAGAPVLAVLGGSLAAWKTIALAWTAAIGAAGFVALDRHVGRFGAFAFLAAWAAAAPGLTDLSLMSWGNHAEVTLFVLVALALVDRPLACGVACGLGFWFSRTAAWGVGPIALASLVRKRDWRLVAGVAVGLMPLLVPAAPGDVGRLPARAAGAIQAGEVLDRARMLFAPAELASRLFPGRDATVATAGVLAAFAVGEGALLAGRRWLLASLAPAFALAYVLVGFTAVPKPDVAPVLSMRYHAPWFQLVPIVVGAGAGVIAGRSRIAAVALVAVPVVASLAARGLPEKGDGAVFRYPGPAWAYFGDVAQSRLSLDELDAIHTDDPASLAVTGRLRGAYLGAGVTDEATFRDALAKATTTDARLSLGAMVAGCGVDEDTLLGWLGDVDDATARDVLRGAAHTAAMRGARAKTGVTGLLRDCRADGADAVAACLAARSEGDPDTLFEVGVASSRRARDPRSADRLSAALDPALATAFDEGRRCALAGVDHPGVPPDECRRTGGDTPSARRPR